MSSTNEKSSVAVPSEGASVSLAKVRTSKYTPGPWIVDAEPSLTAQDMGLPDLKYLRTVSAPDHDGDNGIPWLVAVAINGLNNGDEELEANQRLIAAAPDLLQACQNALGTLNRQLQSERNCGTPFGGDDEHESINVLTAAIAKAKGESV